MSVAIQTRYFGPGNVKGSRIKAYTQNPGQSVTVYWNHALGIDENHRAAATALIRKLEWHGVWASGGSADKRGDTFVCIARHQVGFESDRYRAALALCDYGSPVFVVTP